ncbi:MAG: hypothetical protein K2M34_01870 [Alphaproteobacteria bacterium]|nr:hypothetical protein [Alphaproteobacteria bacterium]
MMRNIGKIFAVMFLSVAMARGAVAADLSGVASVNVTSDTAADAKTIALNQARRQIVTQVLSKYADANQVQVAVKDAKQSELMNLISSSSIDGERQSDTTYTANVTMFVDEAAAHRFFADNNIQNWLSNTNDDGSNGVMILVSMSDRVGNWMELKRIARSVGTDVNTKYIMGNQATIEMPVNLRGAFISAARGAEWRVADQDGALRIWK